MSVHIYPSQVQHWHNRELALNLYTVMVRRCARCSDPCSATILLDLGSHNRRCVQLCCQGLMAVVYDWILFCLTFHRHLCAASPENGGEMLSRRELNHRARPSSPKNTVVLNNLPVKISIKICELMHFAIVIIFWCLSQDFTQRSF